MVVSEEHLKGERGIYGIPRTALTRIQDPLKNFTGNSMFCRYAIG